MERGVTLVLITSLTAFVLISIECLEMLNKLKLTRQGSLLYIQSSKYTLGIELPRKVVSHARLTWTFVTPESGERKHVP